MWPLACGLTPNSPDGVLGAARRGPVRPSERAGAVFLLHRAGRRAVQPVLLRQRELPEYRLVAGEGEGDGRVLVTVQTSTPERPPAASGVVGRGKIGQALIGQKGA